VYFGPDGPPGNPEAKPKVFLRFLLYATGKRGHIVEAMFARLTHAETRQTFDIWVYGDKELRRGSGLHVPPEGVATNHHFLLPGDESAYHFHAGTHSLEVWASVVGQTSPLSLAAVVVEVSDAHAAALASGQGGLYFDWNAEQHTYRPHLRRNFDEPARRDISGGAA